MKRQAITKAFRTRALAAVPHAHTRPIFRLRTAAYQKSKPPLSTSLTGNGRRGIADLLRVITSRCCQDGEGGTPDASVAIFWHIVPNRSFESARGNESWLMIAGPDLLDFTFNRTATYFLETVTAPWALRNGARPSIASHSRACGHIRSAWRSRKSACAQRNAQPPARTRGFVRRTRDRVLLAWASIAWITQRLLERFVIEAFSGIESGVSAAFYVRANRSPDRTDIDGTRIF